MCTTCVPRGLSSNLAASCRTCARPGRAPRASAARCSRTVPWSPPSARSGNASPRSHRTAAQHRFDFPNGITVQQSVAVEIWLQTTALIAKKTTKIPARADCQKHTASNFLLDPRHSAEHDLPFAHKNKIQLVVFGTKCLDVQNYGCVPVGHCGHQPACAGRAETGWRSSPEPTLPSSHPTGSPTPHARVSE